MARSISLKPKETQNEDWPWLVNIPKGISSSGKRERRFFKTKALAETFAKQQRIRVQNYGTSVSTLPPGKIEEAAIAFERLAPFGVNLTTVVDEYVRRRETDAKSCPFSEAFRLFEEHKPKRRSDSYRHQLKQTRSRFEVLQERLVSTISRKEIEAELDGVPPGARNAFLRVLRAVFNFAIKREWTESNPVLKIDMADVDRGEIKVLTLKQTGGLLSASLKIDPEMLPYHALGLFAGIRPKELDRMTWEQIHMRDREIKLPPEVTKTRNGRTIAMEPVLFRWLNYHIKAGGRNSGEIVPKKNQRTRLRRIREKAGATPWIQDAMRHSYASHWLKAYDDKDKLLGYMGHATDDMLINNYLRAVDRKTAARYWKIEPPKAPGNVVSMVA